MTIRSALRRCGVVLLSVGIFSSSTVSAATEYVIGVEQTESYLPYSDYNDGVYSGLGKDILDLFAKKKGYVFTYKALPLKRKNKLYTMGKLDFIYPDNPKWNIDMKKDVDITYAALLDFTDGVIVLKENVGKGVGALKKLGVPSGFTAWPYLGLSKEGKVAIEESYYNGLYKKLLKKRINGAYVNVLVALSYWSKIEGVDADSFAYDSKLPHTTDSMYFSSIKYPKIVKEFELFLTDSKSEVEALKKKYDFK